MVPATYPAGDAGVVNLLLLVATLVCNDNHE